MEIEKKISNNKKQIDIKKQPNDFHSERMIIGQLIYAGSLGNKELDKIMMTIEILSPAGELEDHFYNPIHRVIYNSIYTNYCRQRPISSSILAPVLSKEQYFQNDKATTEIYLDGLVQEACMSSQVYEIAKYIIDLSVKRQIMQLASNLADDIANDRNVMSYDELIQDIEKNLANLSVHNYYNRSSETLENISQAVLEKIAFNMRNVNELNGLSTGYQQLDKMLAGFQNSDLVIIAARPAMGKTSLALCLALNVAEYMRERKEKSKEMDKIDNKIGAVGFVSLEMSSDQLVTRLISMKSSINAMKLRTGHLNDDEYSKVSMATNNLKSLDFVIDDTAAISILELRSKARRMVINHKLKILFVDYLQLLHGTKKSSDSNRVSEISEISRGLKQIAKELNIPVIALSQLSREVEKREDKIPRLSDLRESGSIEQDADIVMFIHREEYYLRRQQPTEVEEFTEDDNDSESGGYHLSNKKKNFSDKMDEWQAKMEQVLGKASIIIAKHRNGPVGNLELRFDHDTTAFVDPEKYSEEGDFFEEPF